MVLNEDNIGKLEDAAAKRKQKLLALKKRKKGETEQENSRADETEELPTTKVLFRNYEPKTEKLEEVVLPQVEPSNVENLIEDQLKFSTANKEIAEVEINSLAPKKITYDLRRGIQAELDKLERRTDKAIAELIRERLKEGKQQDFLMAVNVGAKAIQKDAYDSDEE